MLIDLIIF